MASILRSSKFVRYIAGFARNVVLNTPREFDGSLVNTTHCICGAVSQPFASQASVQHEQNLERSLRRIDQDVRKSGRISRRDIEDVLEEIRSARSASSSQSLLVIRCCGNLVPEELPQVRTKLVEEIWNTLKKLNVPMDVSHYNALLRVYLENEHEFSPTEFLADLENQGIEPNRVTYQRLVSRYCQIGDIEGATKILEFMREKQLAVNENVFNALIVGHSKAGDMDSAYGILSVMAQAGLEPSADTYTTLLCGYAMRGDMESIRKVCEECETKEIYLLDKDYLDIVYALATNGHEKHVPEILSKVRKAIGYNQDAINLILRLVNKGQDESAFQVLKSMLRGVKVDGSPQPTGGFFIKQLVKANRPVEKIIKICERLQEEQMYERGLSLATETSLEFGNDTLAYSLLEELNKQGTEIRQHYFWPLIISKSDDPTGREIVKVLNKMSLFNVPPNAETIREYVIPNLKGNSSQIMELLREANISVGASACSLIVAQLQRGEIKEAATLASTVPAYYYPELVKKPLTNAYYRTKDLESYISIIRSVYDNLSRKTNIKVDSDIQDSEVVGQFLLELSSNKRGFLECIEDVLKEVVDQGLSISASTAEKLQDKLGEKMTDSVSKLLGVLSSGELTPKVLERKPPSYTPSHQMNISQLERLIANLTAKNQDTKGLKRQLFTLYYRAKDLEKTEKLLEEVKGTDFLLTPGVQAQLLDLYAHHDKVEKALEYYNGLKSSTNEDFVLDETKIIKLAYALEKAGRFEECLKILETTVRDNRPEERSFAYNALVWRFLNSLAEQGRVDDLNKLFETLLEKGFIEVNNVLLGPLIKVHAIKKDIDAALEKFEWCVNQFRATPWKNELACQLIQMEDAEKLQKLTDLSTSVHGEINSLYDLVFAFVECGRVRQARKILETPGLQNRPQRINSACERYQQEGQIKPLENLKDATKDLNHIDRSDIYYQLLLSYIKQEDDSKALGLWTQMQEEDMAPTDQFLLKLGEYLQSRGIEVPFVMPSAPVPPTREVRKKANTEAESRLIKSTQQLFRARLKENDIDGALEIKKQSSEKFAVVDVSNLIEKLCQADRIKEANTLTLELLKQGNLPVSRVFRFLLNKLASAGEVDALASIGSKINQEVKKIISFDNRMCHANLVAGRAEEYLKKLEDDIEKANGKEELERIGERFPRGGACGILERHPELTQRYEEVALKYANKGIIAPLNVLWTNYFVLGNEEKANHIWDKYLKDSPRIMFQRIVQAARDKQDEVLINKLIEHLKISKVTEGAIGNAYSCLLDVLVAKGKENEVIPTFEKALKDVKIESINRTAVLRVKELYDRSGKAFNYKVPPKVNKNVQTSTSSSSSSEEEAKKKSP